MQFLRQKITLQLFKQEQWANIIHIYVFLAQKKFPPHIFIFSPH